jgi:hypothetical protein
MPIQIAPDDCDLELGRPCKAGILPRFLEIMDLFVPARWAGVWFKDLAPTGGSGDPTCQARTHIYRERANRLSSAARILAPGFRASFTIAFR